MNSGTCPPGLSRVGNEVQVGRDIQTPQILPWLPCWKHKEGREAAHGVLAQGRRTVTPPGAGTHLAVTFLGRERN